MYDATTADGPYNKDANKPNGHLSEALIAQSFYGSTEFGYYSYTGPSLIDLTEGNTSGSDDTSEVSAHAEQAQTVAVLSTVLRTGDDSHLGLWIALLTLSMVGLCTGIYFKQKRVLRDKE